MLVPSRTRASLDAQLKAHFNARSLSGPARAALISELLLLSLGLRSAVLLSLPASAASALAAALQQWRPPLRAHLRVWLHQPSGALGVLNVEEVLRSKAEPTQPVCVDVRAESRLGAVLPSLPPSSQQLLDGLFGVCAQLAHVQEQQRDAGLLLLSGGPREAGVAVAGWLLGYSVLYSLAPLEDCDETSKPAVELVPQLPRSTAEDAQAEWDAAAPNNLADAPLLLYQALLQTSTQRHSLYAFSVPQAAFAAIRDKLSHEARLPLSGADGDAARSEALLAHMRRQLEARRQRALAQLSAEQEAARVADGELHAWLAALVLEASCEQVSLPLVAL